MATFTKLKSGKWRAQVRRSGIYRNETFTLKRDAEAWAMQIELQAEHIAATGFQPVPDNYTVADLIDSYGEQFTTGGKTKLATHKMLRKELGSIRLRTINSLHMRDFIDRRLEAGAGGTTIAADLSFFGAILKWGRHARQIDLPTQLTLDARRNLTARGLNTRSKEREREPTSLELENLYNHWKNSPRQEIPMEVLCRFALATAMRQEEICSIKIEDVDTEKRTVIIRDRKDPKNKQGNDHRVPLLEGALALVVAAIGDRKSGPVFPYEARSVSTAFTRACTTLRIKDLRFHDLRHKATSDLFRLGLQIPQVALLTGHKNWTQLRRYTHTTAEDVHAAIATLNKTGTTAA